MQAESSATKLLLKVYCIALCSSLFKFLSKSLIYKEDNIIGCQTKKKI